MQRIIESIIIDDESAFINTLDIMIKEHPDFKIIGTARSVKDGIIMIRDLKPDIVFLDIQLEDGLGFDVLKATESLNYIVIFVTAFDYYAVEAFRFSAIDYLLKPISSDNLKEALEKVNERLDEKGLKSRIDLLLNNYQTREKHKKKIVLKELDTHHVLSVDDIICCSAEGSYTKFFIKNNIRIVVSKHLKEYEKLLENYNFIRVHRSHLVNVDKIIKYEKRDGGLLSLEEDIKVMVSVRKKDKISAILKDL
jgi:two-component system LytT family response regulator